MLIDGSAQVGWVAGTCEGLAAARHSMPDDACALGQLHDLLSRCLEGPSIGGQLRLPRSALPWLLGAHAADLGQPAAITSCSLCSCSSTRQGTICSNSSMS